MTSQHYLITHTTQSQTRLNQGRGLPCLNQYKQAANPKSMSRPIARSRSQTGKIAPAKISRHESTRHSNSSSSKQHSHWPPRAFAFTPLAPPQNCRRPPPLPSRALLSSPLPPRLASPPPRRTLTLASPSPQWRVTREEPPPEQQEREREGGRRRCTSRGEEGEGEEGGGGGAGLDRKRISDALDKHLEKAVAAAAAAASPSTSRGSAGGRGGGDHQRLVVPSSASSMPKGRCSEGDVTRDATRPTRLPPPLFFFYWPSRVARRA